MMMRSAAIRAALVVAAMAAEAIAQDAAPTRLGPPVVVAAGVSSPAPATQPADALDRASTGRANPFAPSSRRSAMARLAATRPDGQTAAVKPVPLVLPVLEGVIVRDNVVLACLRCNGSSVVVEPGGMLGDANNPLTLVACDKDAAVLRSLDGRLHLLRVGVRNGSEQPATAVSPGYPASPASGPLEPGSPEW